MNSLGNVCQRGTVEGGDETYSLISWEKPSVPTAVLLSRNRSVTYRQYLRRYRGMDERTEDKLVRSDDPRQGRDVKGSPKVELGRSKLKERHEREDRVLHLALAADELGADGRDYFGRGRRERGIRRRQGNDCFSHRRQEDVVGCLRCP